MSLLSALYGRVAQLRRQAYEGHPDRQRRLLHPVVSVGNVSVGGSGKTPVVATVATLLQESGERPAILSRGYGRRRIADGAVVVSDGTRLLASVEESGDEPRMLANLLPGVVVIVAADRYVAGRLAEQRFDATVSVLDDGFQHVQLARDVDLLLVSTEDLNDSVLPSGRLREPLGVARRASAILVPGTAEDAARVGAALGHATVFQVQPAYDQLQAVGPAGPPLPGAPQAVVAIAGIARPQRFFDSVRLAGWDVRRQVTFPDHHWFTAKDVDRIRTVARECGASLIVTTQKDSVRLEPLLSAHGSAPETWAYLPMRVSIEPAAVFRQWLLERVAEARS